MERHRARTPGDQAVGGKSGGRGPRRRPAIAGVLITAALLAGCGDDEDPDTQPSPYGTIVGGEFDDLLLFRAATPIQPPTEQDGVIAASYEVETARPDTVIDFYQEELPANGWTQVGAVAEIGRDVYRGEWVREGSRLEVSTSPLTRLSGDATHTQLDLVLHDE